MVWNIFNKQTADNVTNTGKLLSVIAEKNILINLLLDAIDHSYLQTDGTYGDLSKEVSDKVRYIKNKKSQAFDIEEITNLDNTIVNFILPRLKIFREVNLALMKSNDADLLQSLDYVIDYFENYEKHKNSQSDGWKAMTNTAFKILGECFSKLNTK